MPRCTCNSESLTLARRRRDDAWAAFSELEAKAQSEITEYGSILPSTRSALRRCVGDYNAAEELLSDMLDGRAA